MPKPTLVTPIDEEKQLRILWDDDELNQLPFAYLRGWCPCAMCQGHSGERRFVSVDDPQLVEIRPVGNYALNIVWKDCENGIYTFDYLRELGKDAASRSKESRQE